jgi:hypothetical protein
MRRNQSANRHPRAIYTYLPASTSFSAWLGLIRLA